ISPWPSTPKPKRPASPTWACARLRLTRTLISETTALLDNLLADRFDAGPQEADRARPPQPDLTDDEIQAEVDIVPARRFFKLTPLAPVFVYHDYNYNGGVGSICRSSLWPAPLPSLSPPPPLPTSPPPSSSSTTAPPDNPRPPPHPPPPPPTRPPATPHSL